MALKLLLICCFFISVVHPQMIWNQPQHPGIQHGHRPVQAQQPVQPTISERVDPMEEEKPKEESPVDINSLEPPKVFIRLASEMKPPLQKASNKKPLSEGCECLPLNDCPIEMMNFAFGVSCPYGTVRCCRPAQPVVEPEVTTLPPDDVDKAINIVTPVSVLQMPTTTPTPITETPVTETEILGNSQFRPINLPFMKVPATAEHEHHLPTFQINPQVPTQFQAMPGNVPVISRPLPSKQQFMNVPGRFQHPIPLQQSVTPTSFPTQQHQAMGFQHQQPGHFNALPTANQPFISNIQNAQQFRRPPPPPSAAVMSTLFQQQQQQRPPQQSQSSGNGGGFFSSLMNMFSK